MNSMTHEQQREVTAALVAFVVRASKENATPQEVKALADVASVLFGGLNLR